MRQRCYAILCFTTKIWMDINTKMFCLQDLARWWVCPMGLEASPEYSSRSSRTGLLEVPRAARSSSGGEINTRCHRLNDYKGVAVIFKMFEEMSTFGFSLTVDRIFAIQMSIFNSDSSVYCKHYLPRNYIDTFNKQTLPHHLLYMYNLTYVN